ncbi:MAG TPA: 2-nitropropane dioxygenase, partial [Chloroflexota bacterium]|nr:2-nitropropane dioxygenase [Chloroflexota bacterium]
MGGLAVTEDEQHARLLDLDRPVAAVRAGEGVGLTSEGTGPVGSDGVTAWAPALPPTRLGDPTFRREHGVRLAYMAGAMANGIASEEVVIAMGRAGLLGSFGAAGLVPARVEAAIRRIQQALPNGPYAFNLIHSPAEEALERGAVELYLRYGVRTVEASAFLDLTPHIVRYRVAGLRRRPDGGVEATNR